MLLFRAFTSLKEARGLNGTPRRFAMLAPRAERRISPMMATVREGVPNVSAESPGTYGAQRLPFLEGFLPVFIK